MEVDRDGHSRLPSTSTSIRDGQSRLPSTSMSIGNGQSHLPPTSAALAEVPRIQHRLPRCWLKSFASCIDFEGVG